MPSPSKPLPILSRLSAALAAPPLPQPRVSEPPVHAEAVRARDALSGSFGTKIVVKPWLGEGRLRAMVPVAALTPTGVKVVEWAFGRFGPAGAVLSAPVIATENAERRVAKALGEGWAAKLVGYEPFSKRAIFEVSRAAPAA